MKAMTMPDSEEILNESRSVPLKLFTENCLARVIQFKKELEQPYTTGVVPYR